MRQRPAIATLAAFSASALLVSCQNNSSSMLPPFVGQSGQSFPLGDDVVVVDYGYVDDGDTLVYAIIRTWAKDATLETKENDPRYNLNPGGLPQVRHADGQLKEVGTDGQVYMFFGNDLRTMRVAMDEHTDTVGISQQETLEGIWTYLTQFRIPDQ